jgi:hypothetical membrane protein
MIIDKDWKLGKNYISDLGVSKTRAPRYMFNGGCIVCGIVFAVSMIGFILATEPTLPEYVLLILSVALGFFLAGVGLFPEDKIKPHKYAAFSYFVVRFALLITMLVLDISYGQYILAVITAVAVAVALVCAKKLPFPITEVIWVSLLGVVILHFLVMI